MIREMLEMLVEGQSLSMSQASEAMTEIMNGNATPAQIGAFMTALRVKGETVDEIAGMASVMREKALHVNVDGPLLDTAGTGGDASNSFNISTTAGFVLAGAGVKIAKHGNRAMSGACGSADVLEALGVNIELGPEGVARCIEYVGFGFMFAQKYHPSMKHAAGPRREIGIRTVFNILGPLTNPAGAKANLVGVADPAVGERMAEVLGRLGGDHALVVHGNDGLDEVSLSDASQVWEMKDGSVSSYKITPEELGFERAPRGSIRASSAKESVQILRGVLEGVYGPTRNVVLMNAAAGFLAVDRVRTLKEGVAVANKSIDSGNALKKMEALVELSQKLE